MTKIQPR